MLLPFGFANYSFSADNWGTTPSFLPGTSVVPGSSSSEGSATELLASGTVTQDLHWLQIRLSDGATSGAQKDHLLDIGWDPAGGTSYTWLFENFPAGQSGGINIPCPTLLVPVCFPAGSSVACRVQGGAGTAGTVRVMARGYGQPDRPESAPQGMIAETFGTVTASRGTTFTPGTASWGSWTSLGTTTNALKWWVLGVQNSTATASAHYVYVELGYGDGTTMTTFKRAFFSVTGTEQLIPVSHHNSCATECYTPVPAGAEIWVRGYSDIAPVGTWNAQAVGFGW